ncbi:acyl-CoA dehydrogenase family protein [Variovorax sp. LjRoot290]|uniref:acyl-CoA dehydrogenase family protein n=1 Tax=Variovorax sp. LjRoot290 TaxID=3342316 RepID=UPI003ECFA49D
MTFEYEPSELTQRDELLYACQELSPILQAANDTVEKERHLPNELAETLAQAGLYRMFVPRALGGLEADVHTFVAVVEKLAQANAAAAWCTFISNTSTIIGGYLPGPEAKVIFKNPNIKMAGVFAPRGTAVRTAVDGVPGFLVNGSWMWGSASYNADFITGGCVILGEDGKPEKLADGTLENRSMIFRAEQVSIADTWHTLGLRGTGSNEYSVKDVFVPAGLSASILTDVPIAGALFKFPVFCILGVGIAAVALGIARLAIDSLIELATKKTPQGSARLLAERASTQQHVARAEAQLRSARAFLIDAVDRAWSASNNAGEISVALRRDLRLATTHASEQAVEVVTRVYSCAGGSAIFNDSRLQRCLRDVLTASQHMMVSESTYELTGRLYLGLPTNSAML